MAGFLFLSFESFLNFGKRHNLAEPELKGQKLTQSRRAAKGTQSVYLAIILMPFSLILINNSKKEGIYRIVPELEE